VVRVWDALVRIGHWSLVVCVAAAWFTRHDGGAWHEWTGYAAVAIVTARLIWGAVGTHYALFTQFVHGPHATIAYTRTVLRGDEPRHLGHNPLGAWMIVALIATIPLTGLSGWMYTTDRFWGVAWVGTAHEWLADGLLVLVSMHVAGVLFSSIRHRENLVAAMLHGKKRAADGGDVT
jgi:cytochrome b